YHLIEAEEGITGIELAQKEQVDLILLDINMAGMNGFEIATRLKSIDKCKHIPLVALTANVQAKSRERALIAGCDGFLTKPITRDFLDRMEEYLKGKKDFIDPERIPDLLKEHSEQLVYHLEKEIKELQLVNKDLKEVDKIKSDFISIASHELRTPLVTIIGYIGLLLTNRMGQLNPEHEKILRIVERNTKRLERIIKDMLTLSYIENEVPFMEIDLTDITEIVKTVLEDYAMVLQDRKQVAQYHLHGDIPKIECDSVKITQVISNLVNNSIKYTENEGAINVEIYYPSPSVTDKHGLAADQHIEIVVSDTGIGIPEEKLSRVFNKFVELIDIEKHHSSDSEFMGGGTGLGLPICKGILKRHHGFIWAENKKDKGLNMYVVLPLKISDKEAFKKESVGHIIY
ncbi:MAG: hybrid sensor histidine kinase/response regulator, partial [Spirochaetes bacterium]|nr:hybrid sensor histidine kinase/response regulator [Spirochaetota bacterium]